MFNITPVHGNLTSVGSNQTHTSLVVFYDVPDKAFQDLAAVGGNQTHTSLTTSTYQYLIATNISVNENDVAQVGDSTVISLNFAFDEAIPAGDSVVVSGSPSPSAEGSPAADEVALSIILSFDEGLPTDADGGTSSTQFVDGATLGDSVSINLVQAFTDVAQAGDSVLPAGSVDLEDTALPADSSDLSLGVVFDEALPAGDSSSLSVLFDETDTVRVGIWSLFSPTDSTKIIIAEHVDATDSTMIGIIEDSLVDVTTLTACSNPFLPTVAVDGAYIVANSSTLPPNGIANTQVYVNLNAAGMFPDLGVTACNVFSFNLNLGFGGGTGSILTNAIGTPIGGASRVFGLNSVAVTSGTHVSNSAVGYLTNYYFGGSGDLNRQIQLFADYGNYSNLLPNQFLQSPPSSEWTTVASAAAAIATAAGIGLSWLAPDAPLTDMFPQTGLTVESAIQSLAAKVGAIMVWNGGTGYNIITPDSPVGGFSVNCKLLGPGGAEVKQLYNLNEEILLFPIHPVSGGGVISSPTPLNNKSFTASDKIIKIGGQVTKKLESNDAPRYFDVPGNAQTVWTQILVNEGAGNYVTTDPSEWFVYGGSQIYTSYGQKQIVVSSSDMPEGVDAIDNNNFNMSFGYTINTDDYVNNFNKAQEENTATGSYVVNQAQEQVRYVRTSEGTVNTIFYGVIPIPGMAISGTATANGITVNISGIIESVSVSSPGVMQISFATYEKLNFIQPTNGMFATSTGGPFA